jgi:hypothetical protein
MDLFGDQQFTAGGSEPRGGFGDAWRADFTGYAR